MTVTTRALDVADPNACRRADAFVRARAEAKPFHLPAWSRAVARGVGQASHYLVAERGAALVAVLPLTRIRSRLFGNALVSAGFAVGGGVLGDDDEAARSLLDEAWTLARRCGCPTLEVRGGAFPRGATIDADTYVNFTRPLAIDDAAELLAIPKRQRAEVRKALAQPFSVESGRDAGALAAHYGVYAESVRNLGTPVFARRLFTEMVAAFGTDVDILTVRHEGRALSSVLSFYLGGTVYPFWGGGTAEARKLRANDCLYFSLMRHARERGCTAFDFGRSKVGTGAALWKKTWGFDPVPLAYAKRTADGALPREINPMDPRYRLQVQAWQRLPLWVANTAGPWIARGLG